ncbi:MAG: transcription-repair coupling factor [Candidatus Alcyoniella australis]|nr:transcription-repair coupling factor [Candidatus Alcyoniella australis]
MFPERLDQLAQLALDARPAAAPGLAGSAPQLLLSRMLERLDRPILLITPDRPSARLSLEALRLFLGESADEPQRVIEFPDYDVAPYEAISPAGYTVAERIRVCHRLGRVGPPPIVVAAARALTIRAMPPQDLEARLTQLRLGQHLDREELIEFLVQAGFVRSPLVEDLGDFSARGELVDVFLPQLERPVRIEFDIDRIKSIRTFDPQSQRTRSQLDNVAVIPFREIALTAEARELFARQIKRLADELNIGKRSRDRLEQSVRSGVFFPGIEFFSALFFERPLVSLLDYLPHGSLVALLDPLEVGRELDKAYQRLVERRDERADAGMIVPHPEQLGVEPAELMQQIQGFKPLLFGPLDPTDAFQARIETLPWEAQSNAELRDQIVAQPPERMLEPLVQRLRRAVDQEAKPLAVAHTAEQRERLARLLAPHGVRAKIDDEAWVIEAARADAHDLQTVTIVGGELTQGLFWPEAGLFLLAEEELFGQRRRRSRTIRQEYEAARIEDFDQIGQGDYLVHAHNGIGRYSGLARIKAGDTEVECMLLEYARGDRLYVPVDRLGLVQRYVGGEGHPTLDRLGGVRWNNARKRARKATRKMAKQLLALYAARRAQPGYGFSEPDATYEAFAATFPFEETPDQQRAIQEVLENLQQPRPMDRLVCGDVGFGKTEVALRAAFLAAMDGKQVAVLVPTTTLAYQHFRTFSQRLEKFPLKVGMLSRFVPTAVRRQVVEQIKVGQVDLVVGTHQLLSKSIQFKDLGLLIVDEEQHFGVAQKERIKQLRHSVDVLTMTATPIPRTFHMSLTGLMDLSTINTPPQDRLAVKTFIAHFDEDTIRQALLRELGRGGQAFVIHNRVRTIDSLAGRIARLLPEARIEIAHGQMAKGELEQVMIRFARNEIDVLVCTAIIEAGIDFPNVNTIIIDRADTFGLSQLYQLRGRVGRGNRRAFCYALVPHEAAITPDAKRRLDVLRRFTKLGSGFRIAQHDLEIRGAGNLLGGEQWGHLAAIGFEMYAQMLERAVKEMRGEAVTDRIDPEVNLPLESWIPESYVADQASRLTLYKRIAACAEEPDLEQMHLELEDRFGALPPQALNLLKVMGLRLNLARLGVANLDYGQGLLALSFDPSTLIGPQRLVEFVTQDKQRRSITPEGRLLLRVGKLPPAKIISFVNRLLRDIQGI